MQQRHESGPESRDIKLTYEERRSALTRKTVRRVHVLSETEIGQPNVNVVLLAPQKVIPWLDIAVSESLGVDEIHRLADIPHDHTGVLLRIRDLLVQALA